MTIRAIVSEPKIKKVGMAMSKSNNILVHDDQVNCVGTKNQEKTG